MIIDIKKLPLGTRKENIFNKLIKDFNKEARKQKSKYRIAEDYEHPRLIKTVFGGMGDSLGNNKIYYDNTRDEFSFIGGIQEDTFKEVEIILESIKQKFKVEIQQLNEK